MFVTNYELKWLQQLLKYLRIDHSFPPPLHCNNHAAINIIANPVYLEHMKHIKVDCHFLPNVFRANYICLAFILSQPQLADIFTKPLGHHQFQDILLQLGIHNIHAIT